jgi:hypothetical protein
MGRNLHNERLVLGEPRIDPHRFGSCAPVGDRGVVRQRHRVRGVGDDLISCVHFSM